MKATYYVAGGFSGRTEDGLEYFNDADLVEIAAAGHEIGCHSFSHEKGPAVTTGALMDDVDRNAAFVQDLLGDYVMSSFAYPYGEASPRTKHLFGRRFSTSRGIRKGVNTGLMDLSQLKAIGVEHWWWTPAYIEAAVEKARRENGWLILFTHDVSDAPSPYGATPQMLEHALDALKAAQIEVLPVKHALARAMFN
jgi:peptidoglycan/xylan/chitin deacetylase (PgdA/CDA1 family)